MIDVGQKLRKAYFNALSGNIMIESSPVPVVDEKLDVNINEHDTFVLMIDQNETPANNKTVFANEVDFRMQIVHVRKATANKEVVESVSDQILTILFPNRTTVNLTIDAPLKLTYARFTGSIYNPFVLTERGFQISKTLTFKNRITQ